MNPEDKRGRGRKYETSQYKSFHANSCKKKIRFPDEEEAKRSRRVLKLKRGDECEDIRIYECEICGGFHFTKTE